MKTIYTAFSLLFALQLYAGLPESQLTAEYTLTGIETLTDSPYEIAGSGTLNIGRDAQGTGTLNINYSSATTNVFYGSGTINVGTDATSGYLNVTGTNPDFPEMQYKTIMNYSGTINVNSLGLLSINGYIPSQWSEIVDIRNLNLEGMFTVSASKNSVSYIQISNLNFYEGANLSSSQDFRTGANAVWNIYGGDITFKTLRVGNTTACNVTINLKGEDVLRNVSDVSMDTNDVTLNLNVDNYPNTINKLSFCDDCMLNINLSADRSETSNLSILSLTSKNAVASISGASIAIENFANDTIFIGDSNGVTIDENKIYLKDLDMYISVTAYAGETDDSQIFGDWSLDWNESMQLFALNNSAIPEPSSIAFIIGIASLLAARAKAYCGKRR